MIKDVKKVHINDIPPEMVPAGAASEHVPEMVPAGAASEHEVDGHAGAVVRAPAQAHVDRRVGQLEGCTDRTRVVVARVASARCRWLCRRHGGRHRRRRRCDDGLTLETRIHN